MNVSRWLGIAVFILGMTFLISTSNYVGGQDKKEKTGTKTEEPKKEEPKKEVKKEEPKKEEPKKEEPKKDGPSVAKLEFKAFATKDKKFYTEQFTDTDQKLTVSGQEVIQKQKQWFLIEWTVKDVIKEGNDTIYVVTQKIVGVKMDIDIGGNKIGYKSTDANSPKNPMTDFFSQLMKDELTYKIKSDFSSVEIDKTSLEKFRKGLQDINPQMQTLLKAILSKESLQKMAEPTWFAFPKNGEIPGNSEWTKESTLDLGPIGSYKTDFKFNLQGTTNNQDTIGIKTSLTYTPPAEKSGLPFIIHSAKLTTSSGTGTAIFDRTTGRFKSPVINMTLEGTLEIEVGNTKTKVELKQTQEAKTKTTDDFPQDWKSAK